MRMIRSSNTSLRFLPIAFSRHDSMPDDRMRLGVWVICLCVGWAALLEAAPAAAQIPTRLDRPHRDGYYRIPEADDVIRGREIFKGQSEDYPDLQICLRISAENLQGWEAVPVTRKNIKTFRRKTVKELAVRLFDCQSPDVLIGRKLEKSDFRDLLRFMNAHFRLALKN